MKRIVVLGSTGSIGQSTLDVVRHHPTRFRVVALSCHRDIPTLLNQVQEFSPEAVAVTGPDRDPPEMKSTSCYLGDSAIDKLMDNIEADLVVNGIAGSHGLPASLHTIHRGINLALANKESVVMGGSLLMERASRGKASIIPVDSEHSALFHLMRNQEKDCVEELILTASGGAFRETPLEQLSVVTPEDALDHPTWKMGAKITIDSATMANKGLEVIEAMHLFGMDSARIKVLIHPQSCVHSMIRTRDGSLYAQISRPDMRLPIQNALTYPDTVAGVFDHLDLAGKTLTFLPWDESRYPLLQLAYDAARAGGTAPVVYNAANEAAVDAFISGKIPFTSISRVVEKTLSSIRNTAIESIEAIFDTDRIARNQALVLIRSTESCWR